MQGDEQEEPAMAAAKRKEYTGPALFSYGFRPFFLGAAVFAATIILLWMLVYEGRITMEMPFVAVDWHIHEMLFGYAAAVISGFLFTAIPNWTGRMPIRGWPIFWLVALWIAGRIVMAGAGGFDPIIVMVIDCAFLGTMAGMITIEIVAGRNWRNLKIVVPVVLLFAANIGFHAEILSQGSAEYARRAGFGIIVFLIMLIGGRIIPSFTRNWLANHNPGALPVQFNRFDVFALLAGVGAMALWVALPQKPFTAIALLFAAGLHLVRLLRWSGLRTLGSPLLLMLHIAYAFIPLGLAATALGDASTGLHLLGIGAIGGMTLAMMMRISAGHTGRALEVGHGLSTMFILLLFAALIRGFLAEIEILGLTGYWIAAICWALAFAGFIIGVGPWLMTPRSARSST